MAFGLSFGSSKAKSTTDSTVNKTETGTQSGVTSQTQTQTGTQNTNTNTSGSTTESGATKQVGTTSQNTTGQQSTAQTTNSFSDMILSALESKTMAALDQAGTGVDTSGLDFNKDQFVQSGMAAATARQQGELETSLNGLFDSAGGTAAGNSNVALLANRLQGDANANLAGIQAQLQAQGNDILRQNLSTQIAGQGQEQGFAAQLLAALKGGTTTQTGQATTTESAQGESAQVGNTQQSGTSQQSQQQQTDTTQVLASIINQLINSTTDTSGTEHQTTTGKKSGFGAGLSI